MAKITNITEFKSYILSQLGAPIIKVELSDTQLEQISYDSIQLFQRYNYSEGSFLTYQTISLSANVSTYDLSASNIQAVTDIFLSTNGMGSINVLFSPVNMMFGNQGSSVLSMFNSGRFNLSEFTSSMQYLAQIREYFSVQFRLQFNSTQEKLFVTPTPVDNMVGLLQCYKREVADALYNHPLVKKMALAKARVLWGTILGKFNIQLPGGGTLNGNEIKSQGQQEETDVLARMESESEPIDFMCG